MDRNHIKYLVNLGLILSFIITFVSGIMKYPGLLPRLGINYFKLPMGAISLAHDWGGNAMGVFVLFHLILNRRWLVDTTRKIFSRKNN